MINVGETAPCPNIPSSNVIANASQTRTLLIKLADVFDEFLLCCRCDVHNAGLIKFIAKETEAAFRASDKRLVRMLFDMLLSQPLLHYSAAPALRCATNHATISSVDFFASSP